MFIQGKYVTEFENLFAEYCGTKYAIATNSGATSLEVMLRASNIEGKKFLVPTQTFVASVSAIVRSNNIPVITDIDPTTQCLNLDIIKENIDEFSPEQVAQLREAYKLQKSKVEEVVKADDTNVNKGDEFIVQRIITKGNGLVRNDS